MPRAAKAFTIIEQTIVFPAPDCPNITNHFGGFCSMYSFALSATLFCQGSVVFHCSRDRSGLTSESSAALNAIRLLLQLQSTETSSGPFATVMYMRFLQIGQSMVSHAGR